MTDKRKAFLLLAIVAAALYLVVLFADTIDGTDQPKFIRADDGTPCYTYRGDFACDFIRRSKETNDGEFPYAEK